MMFGYATKTRARQPSSVFRLTVAIVFGMSAFVVIVQESMLGVRRRSNVPVALVTRPRAEEQTFYLFVRRAPSVRRILACLPELENLPDCYYPFDMVSGSTIEFWYPRDLRSQTVYFDDSMATASTFLGEPKQLILAGDIGRIIEDLRSETEIVGPDFPVDPFGLGGPALWLGRLAKALGALAFVILVFMYCSRRFRRGATSNLSSTAEPVNH